MDKKTAYILRDYQKEAVDTLVKTKEPGGWILSLPVGSGKSLIIAEATRQLGLPTLIICPSQEILKQDREKLLEYVDKSEIGTYSASLKSKVIKNILFVHWDRCIGSQNYLVILVWLLLMSVTLFRKRGCFLSSGVECIY